MWGFGYKRWWCRWIAEVWRQKLLAVSISIALLGDLSLKAQDTLSRSGEILWFRKHGVVFLLWTPRFDATLDSFTVERRSRNSGKWKTVTGGLTRAWQWDEIQRRAGEYFGALYLSLLGIDTLRDLYPADFHRLQQHDQQRQLLAAAAIAHPALAAVLGITCQDTVQELTVPVQYRVIAWSQGHATLYARTSWIDPTVSDHVPSPENVTTASVGTNVVIQWRRDRSLLQSGTVVRYFVYRAQRELGPYQVLNPADLFPVIVPADEVDTTVFQFADRGLKRGETYFYYVTAVNPFGIESAPSAVCAVTVTESRVPPPPSAIRVLMIDTTAMQLRWSYHSPVEVKGFEIWRAPVDADSFVKVFPPIPELQAPDLRSWIDFSLRPGKSYRYILYSIGSHGQRSAPSDTVVVNVLDRSPPLPLDTVWARGDTGRIVLWWPQSPEPDVRGYIIERSADAPNFVTRFLLTPTPISDTVWIDTLRMDLPAPVAYFVYVVDYAGNRSIASPMVVASVTDLIPPQPPVIVVAMEENHFIVIRWIADQYEPNQRFRVYQSVGSVERWQLIAEVDTPTFRTRRSSRSPLAYRVTAVDGAGNESQPSDIIVFPAVSPPISPPEQVQLEWSREGVRIRWAKSKDSLIQGWVIQRRLKGKSQWIDLAVLPVAQTSYLDRWVEPTQAYHYRIFARDRNWQLSLPAEVIYQPR